MDNLSYVSLSRQEALRNLMEVTANNMANMNTPGFKAQNIQFSEYLKKSPGGGEAISQVKSMGAYNDFGQGILTQTSNKLDFALQGDGYFSVQAADGVRYTRDGSFSLNNKGQIVTQTGHPVLSDSGNPLTIQSGAAQIKVLEDGTVTTEKGSVGKLKVVSFASPQSVVAVGKNLFAATMPAVPVAKPKVEQSMLENSNVQPILEMNRMIEILRMYQSTQNIQNNDHDLARSMIQHLTRV
ncbi:MAG: flagellar basal-body rod protein FlgF [Proteobacteria bacterium]|nr:flagellar basal-body rod protein FlgF [Pseudomonadota bacterium]